MIGPRSRVPVETTSPEMGERPTIVHPTIGLKINKHLFVNDVVVRADPKNQPIRAPTLNLQVPELLSLLAL